MKSTICNLLKIHTDDNVADLLTKAFDVSRFQFLVVSIGMINPYALGLKGGNRCVSDQAKEIQHLKAQIKKLKQQAKPVIKHHRAWMQSVSLKQRLTRKRSSKKQWVHKESIQTGAKSLLKIREVKEIILGKQKEYAEDYPPGQKASTRLSKIEGTDEQRKAEKKFKTALASDEEISRQIQGRVEGEEKKETDYLQKKLQ
ncbi:hypothetical protein Tco_0057672 [Tanacetum coccineum]